MLLKKSERNRRRKIRANQRREQVKVMSLAAPLCILQRYPRGRPWLTGDRDVYVYRDVSIFCIHTCIYIRHDCLSFHMYMYIGWNNPETIAETIGKEERRRKGTYARLRTWLTISLLCTLVHHKSSLQHSHIHKHMYIRITAGVCVLISQAAI